MAHGTKPAPKSRPAEKYQDGTSKAGGVRIRKHAGPGRASKLRPTGIKGSQLQRRRQP